MSCVCCDNMGKTEIKQLVNETIVEVLGHHLSQPDFISKVVEAVSKKLNKEFEKISNKHEKDIKELKSDYEGKIDDIEQFTKRNNLIIYGLPENHNVKPEQKVISLLADKGVVLQSDFIERCFRIGTAQDVNKPRPILVTFTSCKYRSVMLDNKKLFVNTGIVIKEDLTKKRYNLFKYAAETFGFKNTWTINGSVKVKHNGTVHKIKCRSDCDDLLNPSKQTVTT